MALDTLFPAGMTNSCEFVYNDERYGLMLCKSTVYGCYKGENELRNVS
jgi:hypothetical protein